MQFAVLIFINIILWALFYLVISLKLERSATEFREKRFRREMDEVIREFNETAERNISILENRIAIMKKILANTGALRSVDISLMDDDVSAPREPAGNARRTTPEPDWIAEVERPDPAPSFRTRETGNGTMSAPGEPGLAFHVSMTMRMLGERALKLRNSLLEFVYARLTRDESAAGKPDAPVRKSALQGGVFVHTGEGGGLIERELQNAKPMAAEREADAGEPDLSEDELAEMFQDSDDKYGLAAELYRQGYSLEMLSRSSSIPPGEIRLVLNLNKSL